ncbi:MAG: hypothetical protein GF408_01200 [Candidatus Omnitrophica bacterium]|nr:hypothetical protein [Candidatus Omnitrophota bacterium]
MNPFLRAVNLSFIVLIMSVSVFFTKESGAAAVFNKDYVGDTAVDGKWMIDKDSVYAFTPESGEKTSRTIEKTASTTYFVQSGPVPETTDRTGYGGALNLKFYSGLTYDYLREELPGKTVSVTVNIPEASVGSSPVIPNKLRVSLKSEQDGNWVDLFPGGKEWTSVRSPGIYDFNIDIPSEPAELASGNIFDPSRTVLFSVDYYLMQGRKSNSSAIYSFSDFQIEGIKLDPKDLKWQFTKNGYAVEGVYLPEFSRSSTLISAMGRGLDLVFSEGSVIRQKPVSGELNDMYMVLAVYIPQELRYQKGTLALTLHHENGKVRSSVKSFNSCNLEGKVFLTLPLEAFSVTSGLSELLESSTLKLRIKTFEPHTPGMMPIALEPLKIKQGHLIPFDTKWRVRDPQGLGAYPELEVRPDGSVGASNIAVRSLAEGHYQLDAAVKMKGGIDWGNPFYKVELIRDLPGAPVDLDDMRVEVLISPLTDTMDVWQRPFRARVGLKDINGNLMFGPNISLSEGLPSLAALDVSTNNPMPKGLVTGGFDPARVDSVIINIEASHGPTDPVILRFSLSNLSISPREYKRTSPPKPVDFSVFPVEPSKWELTRLIKEAGGYLVGINYPFPVLDLPEGILRVPQIYPSVGMKANDPMHLGFGSETTGKTVLDDFISFTEKDINVVRLLVLGHLDGVYTFDERGKDIADFADGREALIQRTAGMSVEKFADFLNRNESTFFPTDGHGNLLGLEKHVISDFVAFLDILEEVENRTGKRLMAIISFYDFLLGDGSSKEGPLRQYNVGEHPEVVTDPVIKAKAQALFWKILKELSRDERFYRYIAVAEIMNEPANATVLATRRHFVDLLNFVGEGLYLMKDALGPSIPVSVGFRSWPEDLQYWAPIAGGVDVLMIHYWESLESYNIDKPSLWPLDAPAAELWENLGAEPGGRLTGMGEIGPLGDIRENLFRLEKAGYDFSLVWSYSGHDSYNAKPYMDDIKKYQESNYLFAELKKNKKSTIKNAFMYLFAARDLFDSSYDDLVRPPEADLSDKNFYTYAYERLERTKDSHLKDVVLEILRIGKLKGIDLDRRTLKILVFRAVE